MSSKALFAFGKTAVAGFVMLLAAACGGSSGTAPGQPAIERAVLGGLEYGILSKGSLKQNGDSLTGNGTIIFTAPRTEPDHNYAIGMKLEEGGSITLVLHSDNRLASGMRVTFARPARGPLKIGYTVGNETYDFASDYSEEISGINAGQPLSIELDMHEHGDLIAELAGRKMGAGFKTKPSGRFWGLIIDKATVSSPAMKKVKHPH